jgi:tetratricopeptide (TPR) repeat protein
LTAFEETMISHCLFVPLLLALAPCALAQFGKQGETGDVRVRLVFANGRQCNIRARVVLMTGASTAPVANAYTDAECTVGFDNLAVGTYHMVVSGDGIEDTDSGTIQVDNRKMSQFVFITVRPKESDLALATGSGPSVAKVDLNIPKKARKELDKANDLIAQRDWNKAKDELLKALAIYPQYADAYNNLGVIYGRLGDSVREREMLQKAITLNDHLAFAYVNLGKLDIREHNFSDAEAQLGKAANIDLNNPQTLMLLANVELMNGHFDAAIAHCYKVHSLPHDSQTLVHYIAARALERQNRPEDAVVEFRTFLQEEPSGPRADAVRKELSALENQARRE